MMIDMQIHKVDNGYICEWWEDDTQYQRVFEELDIEYGDVDCFQSLLYFITEYFGMAGSKHDPKRIRITTDNIKREEYETDNP